MVTLRQTDIDMDWRFLLAIPKDHYPQPRTRGEAGNGRGYQYLKNR